MLDSDKSNFHELMVGMGELYNKEITKPLLRIYFNALEGLTIDQVSLALSKHTVSADASSSFFPKPGDLVRQLEGTPKQAQQLIEDRAAMAWSCIENAISRIGSYGTLKLEDKQALAAVKAIGGWKSVCACTYDQLVWKQKEFIRAYDCYERTPIEALPDKLPGLIELSEHKQKNPVPKSLMDGLNEYRARIENK